jgi:hypothetical protein
MSLKVTNKKVAKAHPATELLKSLNVAVEKAQLVKIKAKQAKLDESKICTVPIPDLYSLALYFILSPVSNSIAQPIASGTSLLGYVCCKIKSLGF